MRTTLPKLVQAGILTKDITDSVFTSYYIAGSYAMEEGGSFINLIQHIHIEDEAQYIVFIGEDIENQWSIRIDNSLELTEFDVRIYKEIDEI